MKDGSGWAICELTSPHPTTDPSSAQLSLSLSRMTGPREDAVARAKKLFHTSHTMSVREKPLSGLGDEAMVWGIAGTDWSDSDLRVRRGVDVLDVALRVGPATGVDGPKTEIEIARRVFAAV
jgi:hypothetical protein